MGLMWLAVPVVALGVTFWLSDAFFLCRSNKGPGPRPWE